ncbi:MAG TPA: glycosyltransferase family 4 protein, partial [Chitinophagaceae bacterium]|nr:glycosyltransferase family 4 protein [Chitinophagaceae bacterium]
IVFCNKKDKILLKELTGSANIKVAELNWRKALGYVLLHPFAFAGGRNNEETLRLNLFMQYCVSSISAVKADIVHFEFSGVAVNYLNYLHRLKSLIAVSCRGSAEKVKLLVSGERKNKFRQLLKIVDSIHCVSDDMRNTILPYCDNAEKIFINYPGVDAGFFNSDMQRPQNKVPVILSVGRFTFQKDYLTGLIAVKKLKKNNIAFEWRIIGTGPLYEEILFHINEMKLTNEVKLLGVQSKEQIKAAMQQADIFFLPSLYEGIANVALEAMSMQLPAVSTKSGGMSEVIQHGKNGLLAETGDAEMLAENLAALIFDADMRCRLGKAARKKITETFTIQKQISIYEKVYGDLIADRNANKQVAANTKYPLHIGIILPQFPTLSETFFVSQVTGLANRGHKVTVFCSRPANHASLMRVYGLNNILNLSICYFDFTGSAFKRLIALFTHPLIFLKSVSADIETMKKKIITELHKQYLGKYNCDIYHFGYSGLAVGFLPVMDSFQSKIIVSCRGTAENVKPLSEPKRAEQLRILFQKAAGIHCVSAKMSEVVKLYEAPAEKIFVNRPAVNLHFFKRNQPYEESNKIQILSVGRLVFQKGFNIGVQAVSLLQQRFQKFNWVIAGDGPDEEELLYYVHSLGLQKYISLAGKKTVNEIIEMYHQSDIVFVPSVSEGIPNVLLEAMAMELPIVASNCGGIEEAVTNGVDGLIADNYDYKGLATKMYELCISFEKRKELGRQARKKIEAAFSTERYIDVFEQQYYSLLEKSKH